MPAALEDEVVFQLELTDAIRATVQHALDEDIRSGDATTEVICDPDTSAAARLVAHRPAVVAGVGVAALAFEMMDPGLVFEILIPDGTPVEAEGVIAEIAGSAASILTAERTALNFLQHMSGIAGLARRFVQRVPASVKILDTRKTIPGLRALEKYAVRCGGGTNHRLGLHDMIMIKDNHREIWQRNRAGGLVAAVAACRERYPDLKVEVEVDTIEEFGDALRAEPDWIMLDNMSPDDMRRCVALAEGRCLLEASGGIDLDAIDAVAATGIDAISLGCLTHSAAAADIGLDLELA